MTKHASKSRLSTIVAWVAVCMAAEGCNDGRSSTYPVKGLATFSDGTPVESGMVEFRSAELGLNARGKIDPSGRFQLGTFDAADGAVAGTHQVIVTQIVTRTDASPPPPGHRHTAVLISAVSPKHARYETSGLSAEVRSQAMNELKLIVQRRGEE